MSDEFKDRVIEGLATTISEQVNAAYAKARKSHEKLVESVYFYDAYMVPVTEFPMLKVYRRDMDFRAQDLRSSSVAIDFAFVNADIETMPGLLYWVANQTVKAIDTWKLSNPGKAIIPPNVQANAVTTKYPGDTLVYEMQLILEMQN